MNFVLGLLAGAASLYVYNKIQRIEDHLCQIDEFVMDGQPEIHGQCTCPSEN